jgi:hypothetical protein
MARFEHVGINRLQTTGSREIPVTGRHATMTMSIATNPTATDTVVIGDITYAFAADPTAIALTTSIVQVDIGANAAGSLTNLVAAINANGTAGTTYSTGHTTAHKLVRAEEITGTEFAIIARKIGAAGNAIALSETFTDGTDAWTGTATVPTGGVDGTPGLPGEIRIVGGKYFECVKDEVWRCTDNHTAFNFRDPVHIRSELADLTAISAGTDNITNHHDINGVSFETHNMGTQTIFNPGPVNGTGLLISFDLTDTEGMELTQGILGTAAGTTGNIPICKHAMVVGSHPAFFVRALIKIADISGVTECGVGFRKAEAYNTYDGYDEMATLNAKGGNISIETIINGATNVTTDTTNNWTTVIPTTTGTAADGATHELRVNVNEFGECSYMIDGVAPIVNETTAFVFDTGEIVIPFLQLIHATTTPGAIHLVEWEVGYSY